MPGPSPRHGDTGIGPTYLCRDRTATSWSSTGNRASGALTT